MTDYRHMIRHRYAERRLRNPNYSIRAFARDLELSPSHLSEIFNGKEKLSLKTAAKIGPAIGLKHKELEWFLDAVAFESARSVETKNLAKKRLDQHAQAKRFLRLNGENFSLISDWYHLPILEAIKVLQTSGGDVTAVDIAKLLGLKVADVKRSLEVLTSLQMVGTNQGVLTRPNVHVEAPVDASFEAIRNFHHQLLVKASESIHGQNRDQRALNSLVLTFSKANFQAANEMLNDFCKAFNARFGEDAAPDAVYCLATQLFELNKTNQISIES